jgi:hypothetical protein
MAEMCVIQEMPMTLGMALVHVTWYNVLRGMGISNKMLIYFSSEEHLKFYNLNNTDEG